MAAPIRSPVKEPGPDIKVISVMSVKSLPFSCSLSCSQARSFSARSWPKLQTYSSSFILRLVVGVLVFKNNRVILFSTRFVAPVVTELLANSLPVGREMSRKALLRLFLTITSLESMSDFSMKITVWFGGRRSETDAPHSMTMILSGFARFSARSSDMSPGSWRR